MASVPCRRQDVSNAETNLRGEERLDEAMVRIILCQTQVFRKGRDEYINDFKLALS